MVYQEHGFGAAVLKLVNSATKNLVLFFYKKWEELILCKDLITIAKNMEPIGWQVKDLTHTNRHELYEFLRKHHPSKPIRVIENYIRNGYQVFLGCGNGELIGYMWWHDATIHHTLQHPVLQRYNIQLQPGEVYMFDYFIPPEFRGNSNSSHFLLAIYRELFRRGYRRAWGGVVASNLPARFIYQLHGWEIMGKVKLTEFLSALLLSTDKIYLRNFWWNKKHCFDYKFLFDYRN